MTYEEETYVLDTLKELKKKIRDMPDKQAIKEIHENNIMLRQIIKIINTWIKHHPQENIDDFGRNVLANMFSNIIDFGKRKVK